MRRMRVLKSKTTALFAAVLVVGLIAAPASADKENSPPPPGVATCTGTASVWAVDDVGDDFTTILPAGADNKDDQWGLTFPGIDEPRDFAWELITADDGCVIQDAQGQEVLGTGQLEVSGWGEDGHCGTSTAQPPIPKGSADDDKTWTIKENQDINNNRGHVTEVNDAWTVNVWDIHWDSAASVLAVNFLHDAGSAKKPAGSDGHAEVDALGGSDCATTNGANTFTVVIEAELLP